MTIPEEEVEAAQDILRVHGYIADYKIPDAIVSEALSAAAKVRGARERDVVIEECAKVAFDTLEDQQSSKIMRLAYGTAAAIRALKETP